MTRTFAFKDGDYVSLRRDLRYVGRVKEKAQYGYQINLKGDWRIWRIIDGRSLKKITIEEYEAAEPIDMPDYQNHWNPDALGHLKGVVW